MRRRWQRVPVAAFARRQPARISRAAADTSAAGSGNVGDTAEIGQLCTSTAPDGARRKVSRGSMGAPGSGAGVGVLGSAALRGELRVGAL